MGRRYIGIELGEHAVTHCVPRLKKVVDGEQGGISKAVNWQGGGGFRFFRLGQPVFDETNRINPQVTYPALAAHVWFSETKTPLPAVGASGVGARQKEDSTSGGPVLASPLPTDHTSPLPDTVRARQKEDSTSGSPVLASPLPTDHTSPLPDTVRARQKEDSTSGSPVLASPLLGIYNGTAYYLLFNGILGDQSPEGGNVLTQRLLRILPPHAGSRVIYGEVSLLDEARLRAEDIRFKKIPYELKV